MSVDVESFNPSFFDKFSDFDQNVLLNKRKNEVVRKKHSNGARSNGISSKQLSKKSKVINLFLNNLKINYNLLNNHDPLNSLPFDCTSQSIINSFSDLSIVYKTSKELDDNIMRWIRHVNKEVKKEKPLVEYAINRLRDVVKKNMPNVEVIAFGSYRSSLRLPHGDIDLTIRGAKGAPKNILKDLIKHIRPLASKKTVFSVLSARTPIIRYTDAVTGIRIDVNANPDTSIYSTNIMNKLLLKFPALRSLIKINKQLIKKVDLNETSIGGVGSYLLFHMCLAFYLKFGEFCKIDEKYSDGFALLCLWKYYGMLHDYKNVGIGSNGEFITLPESNKDDNMKLVAFSPVNNTVEFGKRAHKIIKVINLFRHTLSTSLLITNLKFQYCDILQFLFSDSYSNYINKHILNSKSLINV